MSVIQRALPIFIFVLLPISVLRSQIGEQVQVFPHVALGEGAMTLISIANADTTQNTVRIDLFRSDGSPLLDDSTTLAVGASTTLQYGRETPFLVTGWARLSADGPFTAALVFEIEGVGTAGVLPAVVSDRQRLFSFVEDGSQTGFAAANPHPDNASLVTARVFDALGEFQKEVSFVLSPMSHTALFLNEEPLGVEEDGILEITSTLPVAAISLMVEEGLLFSLPVATPGAVADGSVTTVKLADGAVVTTKIGDQAVNSRKLASRAVITDKISNLAVTTSKLANAAVTGDKIANQAVDEDAIAPNAVGSEHLDDNIVLGKAGAAGFLALTNELGGSTAELAVESNQGLLRLLDASGRPFAELSRLAPGVGTLVLSNSLSNPVVALGGDSFRAGVISTLSETGSMIASLGRGPNGNGRLSVLSSAGTTIAEVTSEPVSNAGRVSVANSLGLTTAGLNGATGEVFGTTKSFIVPDPDRQDRMIRYTSLEGPEAAIYVRGSARLINGRAKVRLPDHFFSLALPSSITVSLTSRSADSQGLAATKVDGRWVKVVELKKGRGNYRFDYQVHAVRKGFEDHPVYLSKGSK